MKGLYRPSEHCQSTTALDSKRNPAMQKDAKRQSHKERQVPMLLFLVQQFLFVTIFAGFQIHQFESPVT